MFVSFGQLFSFSSYPFDSVAKLLASAPQVVGWSFTWGKYLHEVQIIFPDLEVSPCDTCLCNFFLDIYQIYLLFSQLYEVTFNFCFDNYFQRITFLFCFT